VFQIAVIRESSTFPFLTSEGTLAHVSRTVFCCNVNPYVARNFALFCLL